MYLQVKHFWYDTQTSGYQLSYIQSTTQMVQLVTLFDIFALKCFLAANAT